MGKTTLVTNLAYNVAAKENQAVLFFSLEMSSDQLATRILAEQSRISSETLRMGKITQEEFRSLARASAKLQNVPFYIDDTPGLTIAALRTRARRLKRQKGIGLIIVDYLQLLQGTGRSSNDNRVQEISEISRGLKTLAKELNVPVMALSQLSRAVEQRENKRPQLADLRESGSIEQDADIVMFIYREEYYLSFQKPTEATEGDDAKDVAAFLAWQEAMNKKYGLAELIVAKQRHGSTGTLDLHFEARFTRFSDRAVEGRMPEIRG